MKSISDHADFLLSLLSIVPYEIAEPIAKRLIAALSEMFSEGPTP